MNATLQEYNFHRRLCTQGDPTAFVELAEWLYDSLIEDVRKRAGANADPTLVEEAVGEALLDYQDQPDSYDPNRKGLRSYLAMAAYRDFQNARAREQRLREHQVSLYDPALRETDIVESQERMDDQIEAEELWTIINETFPDSTERRIVELIVNRVRSPEPYIQLLDIGNLPQAERLKQVKLVKYRITRRLRRNLARRIPRIGGTA